MKPFLKFSRASIVNFEQVNAGWVKFEFCLFSHFDAYLVS